MTLRLRSASKCCPQVTSVLNRIAIETLLREHISAAAGCDPLDYLCTTVTRWLGGPVDPDTAGLLDLGVGSLNTARLTAEIASRYGVRLDLSDVITVPSLRHLADLIHQRRRLTP